MPVSQSKQSRLLGWPAAAAVLLAFWLGMLASLLGTSQTLDEGVHVTAGYTFWRYNDYRLNLENGNLPQRVAALPLLFRLTTFLRQREPNDNVGYSILVYHISADELSRALDGPPVELGRDILGDLFSQQR